MCDQTWPPSCFLHLSYDLWHPCRGMLGNEQTVALQGCPILWNPKHKFKSWCYLDPKSPPKDGCVLLQSSIAIFHVECFLAPRFTFFATVTPAIARSAGIRLLLWQTMEGLVSLLWKIQKTTEVIIQRDTKKSSDCILARKKEEHVKQHVKITVPLLKLLRSGAPSPQTWLKILKETIDIQPKQPA